MTAAVAQEALALWGFEGAEVELVAARENQVFSVRTRAARYALRLHRPSYRTDAELRSELAWMAALQRGGLHVPEPVPALDGTALRHVQDVQVDVLGWLDAKPMGTTGTALDHPDRHGLFFDLGAEMAKLHTVSDAWTRPAGFTRWSWDQDGLLGDAPLWDRFWENPTLDAATRAQLIDFRDHTAGVLANTKLDYGLIHADMVRENVMLGQGKLHLIDFDDGGFGYRLFDVATALIKNRSEPDYNDLKAALIAGYQSQRPLDVSLLPLFMALRAVTYVGWIIRRIDEPGGRERNDRFIASAKALIAAL